MKNVMISIKPKWCELIASGKKTIVFRKTRPKDTPFKCYIYCTKSKPLIGNYKGHIYFMDEENFDYYNKNTISKCNGKVIGEFICDGIISHCEMTNADIAEQQGKIKREDLLKYANGKELYGWHISNLKIYDEPKELKRFGRFECEYCGSKNGFGGMSMTREEAIEFLSQYIDNESYTVKCQEALRMAISALRPVRQEQMNKVCTGKWIYTKKGQLVCSCCGFHPTYSHNSNDKMGMSNCRFCPNCGIEMG